MTLARVDNAPSKKTGEISLDLAEMRPVKGALYRIYQVIILCRRFPAKFSDIVSPARDSHA